LKTLEWTHQSEKKSLIYCNLKFRNTVQALEVDAAIIHLTAVVLGAVIILCITGPSK
jgi:hypothetical protein